MLVVWYVAPIQTDSFFKQNSVDSSDVGFIHFPSWLAFFFLVWKKWVWQTRMGMAWRELIWCTVTEMTHLRSRLQDPSPTLHETSPLASKLYILTLFPVSAACTVELFFPFTWLHSYFCRQEPYLKGVYYMFMFQTWLAVSKQCSGHHIRLRSGLACYYHGIAVYAFDPLLQQ